MSVKSAKRVLDIIEMYARSPQPATLTGIAEALGLPKSSCLALIETLETSGYLYQVRPQVGYYPTRRLLEHAQVIAANDPVVQRVEPMMTRLRDETGESVVLARFAGDRVLYLLIVESSQTIRYTARAGEFKALHGTSSGKALLGSLPVDERQAVLERLDLKKFTPRTITRRDALEREIASGIARGFHHAVGEHIPDVTGVARAVSVAGEAYAIAVVGPVHRLADRIDEIGDALVRACGQLGARPRVAR
jgi:IclR family acetate operon transcriptional repressor